jgi:23S rRNA pseudouridine2605 synthase
MDAPKGERIAKVLARAGLCSRREAERWIAAGRVAVDGKLLDTPAVTVTPGAAISVDGKAIAAAAPTRLWRYHKPKGLITSHRDPEGRATVFDRLPEDLPRVISVGRLDVGSEGLLLLTNDGALARHLELPSTGWTRRYRVRVHGTVDPKALAGLEKGVTVDGISYGPVLARLDRVQASNAWLSMALTEGKNREIRRLCGHLGLEVTRLIRISYGPFQLGDLESGTVVEVPRRVLADQLGGLAARFGIERPGPEAKARPRPPFRGRAAPSVAPKGPRPGPGHAHRRRPA